MSGSGITWAICKSAPRSRQITMPAPHHSVFQWVVKTLRNPAKSGAVTNHSLIRQETPWTDWTRSSSLGCFIPLSLAWKSLWHYYDSSLTAPQFPGCLLIPPTFHSIPGITQFKFQLTIKATHTHTHQFNGPLSGTTHVSRYQKGKTNLDFTEARQWVAVASAGPYASLHLTPDWQPHQHPTTQFFTGRMPFLPPNQ